MPRPTHERFWTKVAKSQDSDCWLWTAARNSHNYGAFHIRAEDGSWKTIGAHRYALESRLGRPVKGDVLHRCDNPPCCNPDHLWEGTAKDNVSDAMAKGRMLVGSKNGNFKLTEEKRTQLRELRGKVSYREAARMLGMSHSLVVRFHQKENSK